MSVARSRPRLRIGRHSNGMLMTPEEFDAATNFDRRYSYELIRGILIVSPAPGESERDPNEELGYWLRRYKDDHPQGSALDKTLPEQYVYLSDSRRRADRVLWVGLGRMPDLKKDIPAVVVEFVSKRKRDRVRDYEVKRQEYLDLGVREYWVIDRFQRTMTVSHREANPAVVVVPADGVYQTALLPGFELPLARLFAVADDWSKPA